MPAVDPMLPAAWTALAALVTLFGSVTTRAPSEPSDTSLVPDALTRSPLHQTYLERLAEGRDMRVIISAAGETGVGKSTAGVYLAKLWDIWEWSAVKNTLDPREFSVMYDRVRPGSVTILDDAEQAVDRRRSMSNETLAIGHDFATKRYRQIFGILTLPAKGMIDARIADVLCDYWIKVEDRGVATVYELGYNEFAGNPYYDRVEEFRWPAMDDDVDYRSVERQKEAWMTGQTQSRFVTREEFNEAKKNFWQKAEAKTTYDFVNAAYTAAQDDDSPVTLTQAALGDIVGMGQSNISKMYNSESFEKFYRSYRESEK